MRLPRDPGEWLTAGGILVGVSSALATFLFSDDSQWKRFFDGISILGLGSFLAGLAIALQRVTTFVEKVDPLADAGQAALQYSTAVSLIAESLTIGLKVGPKSAHLQAGGKTLGRYALQILPERARQLRQLEPGGTLSLVEYHFINDFLKNFLDCLSHGSTWFGITHLTEGWLEKAAQPGYREFVSAMQDRCRKGTLQVLRVYCYRDPEEIDNIRTHLDSEVRAGVVVKTLDLAVLRPPDLTLAWAPGNALTRAALQEGMPPEDALGLERREPICGMEFATSGGRLIKKLDIFTPGSEGVRALRHQFADSWSHARPLSS